MRQAKIKWFKAGSGSICFDVTIDGARLLATTHPITVAAALVVAGVEVLELADVETSTPRTHSLVLPMENEDLADFSAFAGEDPVLAALLATMHSAYGQLEYAHTYKIAPALPQLLLHWHLAAMLLPDRLYINVPPVPPPANFGEFVLERAQFIHHPPATPLSPARVALQLQLHESSTATKN
ncbi:hypothetical protein RugamoR57_37280 [Duganella caerulea]|uniref:hypothetical protein n=1 Tax=Duganella caerulea TaxID=2885762 RepID=UPI0030E8DD58